MTKQFRKKPVVIEAVQYTPLNADLIYSWASEIDPNVWFETSILRPPVLIIPTNEGNMECILGDYLIKEPFPTNDRKLYPCKPDIFEQTYEPAELAAAGQVNWIKCSERLPENNQQVLCINKYGRMVQQSWMMGTEQEEEWFLESFTYWSTLPDLPTEKGEGNES